jgi:hypothetical protein
MTIICSIPTNSNDQPGEYHDDLFLQKTTLGEDQINLLPQQTAITQENLADLFLKKQRSAMHGKIMPIFFCRKQRSPKGRSSLSFSTANSNHSGKNNVNLFLQK